MMKNKAELFNQLKNQFYRKDRINLKTNLSKAATPVLVTAVFLVAFAFLIYNSVNALTIWSQNSNANFQIPASVQSETVAAPNAIKLNRPISMKRPEASVYRNGKDASGGVLFPIFPVRGGRVTNGYGIRSNPFDEFGFLEFHAGLDVAVPLGTPVVAAAKGVVTFAGWDGGYGNVVMIEHADGKITTRYGHLIRCDVSTGDEVSSGQQIGLVGSTGRSTGPHLHYEVRIDDKTVDPRLVYPANKAN